MFPEHDVQMLEHSKRVTEDAAGCHDIEDAL